MQFFLEAGAAGGLGGGFGTIIMLVVLVVVFYFLLIRPQKKQEKKDAEMRNSLEIGDEVITIGGIIGQIVKIKGETVTIATGKDRTTLRFLRSAIREVTVKINAPEEPVEKPPVDKKAAAEPIERAPLKDEGDKATPAEEKVEEKVEEKAEEQKES